MQAPPASNPTPVPPASGNLFRGQADAGSNGPDVMTEVAALIDTWKKAYPGKNGNDFKAWVRKTLRLEDTNHLTQANWNIDMVVACMDELNKESK